MPYHTRRFTEADFENLYQTFGIAFQDYAVQMSQEKTDFERRLRRIGADYGLSAGVFEEEKLVAFVIHAFGVWEGKKTLYNGGTGVVPQGRGQKLIDQIYDFLSPFLQEKGIEQVLLEVLCQNHHAIHLYQRLGFKIIRKLNSYVQHNRKKMPFYSDFLQKITFQTTRSPDWAKYQTFQTVLPSWQNSFRSIRNNWEDEILIEAYHQDHLLAFMSLDKHSGRISHLNVLPAYRRLGIGTYMLQAAYSFFPTSKLAMINLDQNAVNFHEFLLKNGFSVEVEQYEMQLLLPNTIDS